MNGALVAVILSTAAGSNISQDGDSAKVNSYMLTFTPLTIAQIVRHFYCTAYSAYRSLNFVGPLCISFSLSLQVHMGSPLYFIFSNGLDLLTAFLLRIKLIKSFYRKSG
ncbi:hypothetical protein KEM48_007797 [Puccinia striiformis f. sp. tritici PST-130]|nr:hypothetical protein KEM48_007797 [Puccinia striiformis f. sp. tritici PST-130]